MQNIEMKVTGTKLVVTIDLSKRLGPSASGKTILIASTGGNVVVDEKMTDVKIGINCYTKPAADAA